MMRKQSHRFPGNSILGLAVCASVAVLVTPVPSAKATDTAQVEKGHYLATAADCVACHTAPGGKPFAGGYPIKTPVGTIYSTNITPSPTTGIGHYTKAEFFNAVQQGIGRGGKRLYPAMPYTSYAGITDNDMEALYAFFT